jgi:hypothetical protein
VSDYLSAETQLGIDNNGHITVLDEVETFLSRFVAFPSDATSVAAVLWVAHTHVVAADPEVFESTPRLAALSPEPGSGKTRLLEVLELIVPHAVHSVNMSAAVLFRLVGNDDDPVTLLMDEADTYLGWKVAREHEDVRGLVNAGHRRGATAYRMQMEGGAQVVAFPAFAAVALAGIGDLPDTIIDRSVVVAMKRRSPAERVEQFRRRLVEPQVAHLVDGIRTWSDAAAAELVAIIDSMDMPDGIEDRPADVWEPLVAIGDLAGDPWSSRLRTAAVALNGQREARDPSLGVQLLRDVRSVFDRLEVDRITSTDLAAELIGIEGAPWADLRGNPIDAHGIAKRLRPYAVRPGAHWIGGGTHRGYLREDFYDAWSRYLPPPADRKGRNEREEPASDPTDLTPITPPTGGNAHPCRGCSGSADRQSIAGTWWCAPCWQREAGGAA